MSAVTGSGLSAAPNPDSSSSFPPDRGEASISVTTSVIAGDLASASRPARPTWRTSNDDSADQDSPAKSRMGSLDNPQSATPPTTPPALGDNVGIPTEEEGADNDIVEEIAGASGAPATAQVGVSVLLPSASDKSAGMAAVGSETVVPTSSSGGVGQPSAPTAIPTAFIPYSAIPQRPTCPPIAANSPSDSAVVTVHNAPADVGSRFLASLQSGTSRTTVQSLANSVVAGIRANSQIVPHASDLQSSSKIIRELSPSPEPEPESESVINPAHAIQRPRSISAARSDDTIDLTRPDTSSRSQMLNRMQARLQPIPLAVLPSARPTNARQLSIPEMAKASVDKCLEQLSPTDRQALRQDQAAFAVYWQQNLPATMGSMQQVCEIEARKAQRGLPNQFAIALQDWKALVSHCERGFPAIWQAFASSRPTQIPPPAGPSNIVTTATLVSMGPPPGAQHLEQRRAVPQRPSQANPQPEAQHVRPIVTPIGITAQSTTNAHVPSTYSRPPSASLETQNPTIRRLAVMPGSSHPPPTASSSTAALAPAPTSAPNNAAPNQDLDITAFRAAAVNEMSVAFQNAWNVTMAKWESIREVNGRDLANLRQQIEQSRQSLESVSTERDRATNALTDLQIRHTTLESTERSLRQNLGVLGVERVEHGKTLDNFKKAVKDADDKITALQNQVRKLNESIAQDNAQALKDTIKILRQEVSQGDRKQEALQTSVDDSNKRLVVSREAQQSMQDAVAQLEQAINRSQKTEADLRDQLYAAEQGIATKDAAIVEKERDIQLKVQELADFAEASDKALEESETSAKAQYDFVKQSADEELQKVFHELGQVSDNLASARKELSREKANGGNWLSDTLADLKLENRRLQEDLAMARDELEVASASRSDDDKVAQLEQDLEKVNAELACSKAREDSLGSDLEIARREKAALVNSAAETSQATKDAISELRATRATIEIKLRAADDTKATLRADLAASQQVCANLTQRTKAAEKAREGATARAAELVAEVQRFENGQRNTEKLQSRLAEIDVERLRDKDREARIEDELKKAKLSNTELEQELHQLKARLVAADNKAKNSTIENTLSALHKPVRTRAPSPSKMASKQNTDPPRAVLPIDTAIEGPQSRVRSPVRASVPAARTASPQKGAESPCRPASPSPMPTSPKKLLGSPSKRGAKLAAMKIRKRVEEEPEPLFLPAADSISPEKQTKRPRLSTPGSGASTPMSARIAGSESRTLVDPESFSAENIDITRQWVKEHLWANFFYDYSTRPDPRRRGIVCRLCFASSKALAKAKKQPPPVIEAHPLMLGMTKMDEEKLIDHAMTAHQDQLARFKKSRILKGKK